MKKAEEKIKEKTDALKYWREFEKFVLDFLKDKYGITDDKFAVLTPPSGDGGYDGIVYSTVDLSGNEIREILFEAKLRSALGTSLPLNDFSKALIVAVNRFTDEVYIATNIIFSPDTLHQLNVYGKRLGIHIETINGNVLYEWYEKQGCNANRKYNDKFIAFLKKSAEAIPANVHINNKQSEPDTINKYTYIKDIDRSKLICSIKESLSCHNSGLVLFNGEQGAGKSCMCTEIERYLEEQGYITFEINMYEQNTSRTIFLKLLECVWGFSPEIIIQSTANEIEELFLRIGTEKLVSSDIECLQFVFSKDIKEYTGNSDIYQYILLNIIERLFRHYSERIPYCIHIHNMESAYEESCDFIQKIISRLSFCKIFFLVEIRENYAGEMKISSAEWSAIKHRLNNLHSIIGEYKICKFSLTESEAYIEKVIPSLNYAQIKRLAQSLPNNPLILDASLHILKPKLDADCLFDAELENELIYFNRNYDSAILKEVLRNVIQKKGFERLIQPFAMLSLLKGKCSIENIARITGENHAEIKGLLYSTGFINIDNNIISVKHEFYIKTLQNYSVYIPNIVLQELAQKMTNSIDYFYKDVLEQSILQVKLLDINQKYDSLLPLCNKTGKALYQQGDTKQALEIYKIAYNAFEAKLVDSIDFLLLKLEILQNLINIKWNTIGGSDDEINLFLEKFHLLISLARRNFKHHIKYIEASIYEILFEMKNMHVKSEHNKCVKNAYKAKRLAQKNKGYQNFPLVLEQILWLKSLSIKHLSGMNACLTSFEYDIQKYPDFPLLYFSYNTHKAAYIAGEKPKIALRYFRANEKYYNKLSMAEQLHNRVNISNMYFFLKEYDEARELSEKAIEDALSYDVNLELGRAYNTIGNCYCAENNPENSIYYYKKSISRFEEIEHSIHLWPPLVNCAFVYVTQNNYEEAFGLIKKAMPIFLKRSNEFAHSIGKEVSHTNKLNIGVIITLHLLWLISVRYSDAKSLYSQLIGETKKYLPEQIDEICTDNEKFDKYFKNSVYNHCGKILLKL